MESNSGSPVESISTIAAVPDHASGRNSKEHSEKSDKADTTKDATSGKFAKSRVLNDQTNDEFSMHIKAQYILAERCSSLHPLPESKEDVKKDRKKGQKRSKKRPRDARAADADKVCLSLLLGKECPYGAEKCRYTHDIHQVLANRPPDISQVEGGCPKYNTKGFCEHGVMCRLGACHINPDTGENLRDESKEQPSPVMNVLSKELQTQLRKKKYPFKCKRYSGKNRDSAAKNMDMSSETKGTCSSTAQATVGTDYSPLPNKRKLIDFSNKVYVAPLTTVGNLPFRRIMKRFGADITCGEMAVATNLLEGKSSEWALLKRHPEEDVFGVQLASGYPDQVTRVCELLEAHATVDFVDFNLGCPLDIICDKGAGSALMLRERKLKQCLRGITSTLSCPLTIKMRTGWADGKPVAHQLASKIQSWDIDGISALMVHGRSRLQRYAKEADWDYISTVATNQRSDLPKIPVIGNGDILSYTDYQEKVAREGLSATAMLARGALIKPWLPTEIKERRHWDISAPERLDLLKDFVRFGLEHWGSDQQGVNNTRRFLLEWLSFLYRYVPVGLLEVAPQLMNHRQPTHMCGRSDLETLFLSKHAADWIRISEMLLGPVPEGFQFEPKHKASG